jgi:hypothetical protein
LLLSAESTINAEHIIFTPRLSKPKPLRTANPKNKRHHPTTQPDVITSAHQKRNTEQKSSSSALTITGTRYQVPSTSKKAVTPPSPIQLPLPIKPIAATPMFSIRHSKMGIFGNAREKRPTAAVRGKLFSVDGSRPWNLDHPMFYMLVSRGTRKCPMQAANQ